MSNPFVIGSPTVFPNGPAQATDNLTGLASATARGLGVINNSAALPYDQMIAPMMLETGAGTVSGTITLLVITSEDGTVWTDGISPTATTDQSSKIVTATIAAVINVSAASTVYYTPEIDIPALLGYVPLYWAVVVWNKSGQALNATATNFYAKYTTISYT